MHNTLKVLSITLIILLCSCSSGKQAKTNVENIEEKTDSYTINCEVLAFDEADEKMAELNSLFAEEANEWIDDFKQRAGSITLRGSEPPCLQVRNDIKLNGSTIISTVTEKYVYLTGLHGNVWWSAKNFDVKSYRILKLSDLFIDDTYEKILSQRITELIETQNDKYPDLWEQPSIDKSRQDKFYLDGKNLVIFYQPYELSYYARGVVEFPIPIEKIRGYIKPEYLPS